MASTIHARVAVIGAGAAGLASAKRLIAHGHSVIIYERNSEVGGTWVLKESAAADECRVCPASVPTMRKRPHPSSARGGGGDLLDGILGTMSKTMSQLPARSLNHRSGQGARNSAAARRTKCRRRRGRCDQGGEWA